MLAVLAILVAIVAIAGYRWSQSQYYVADDGDDVAIFRGVEADVPGIQMHHVEEGSDLTLEDLPTYNARQVRDGISANNLDDARGIVSRLRAARPVPRTRRPEPVRVAQEQRQPEPEDIGEEQEVRQVQRKPQSPTQVPVRESVRGPGRVHRGAMSPDRREDSGSDIPHGI